MTSALCFQVCCSKYVHVERGPQGRSVGSAYASCCSCLDAAQGVHCLLVDFPLSQVVR
jgi:hypothetical protein